MGFRVIIVEIVFTYLNTISRPGIFPCNKHLAARIESVRVLMLAK